MSLPLSDPTLKNSNWRSRLSSFATFVRTFFTRLAMVAVETPIRHSSLQKKLCVMDALSFLDYLNYMNYQGSSQSNQRSNEQIKCPVCTEQKSIDYYGIDRFTLNVIQLLKIQGYTNVKEISYKPTTGRFYVEGKEIEGLQPLQKIKSGQTQRLDIPERLAGGVKQLLFQYREFFVNKTLTLEKAAQKYKIQKNFIGDRINKAVEEFRGALSQNASVKVMGKQQSEANMNQFTFGFFNVNEKVDNNYDPAKPIESLLIVFYPFAKIWFQFKLVQDGKPYVLHKGALCLKENKGNIGRIYIIGGWRHSTLKDLYSKNRDPQQAPQPSKDFLVIEFQIDPFSTSDQVLKVQALPNLPQECFGAQGLVSQSKVYLTSMLLYKDRTLKPTNQLQIFENNKWVSQPLQMLPRIEGSLLVDHARQCVLIFGGFTSRENYIPQDREQEPVKRFEILSLTHKKTLEFSGEYGCTDYRVFINRCLVSPINELNNIVIAGRYLGQHICTPQFKPIISNLTLQKPSVMVQTHDFSQTCSYILDRVEALTVTEMYKENHQFLINDYEGVLINNVFYTIYNQPENLRTPNCHKLNLVCFQYNCANGTSSIYPFKKTENCIQNFFDYIAPILSQDNSSSEKKFTLGK